MQHHRRICAFAISGLALLALTTAACGMGGSGNDSAESRADAPATRDAGSVAEGAVAVADDAAGGGDQALTATPELAVLAADRQQIFTAGVDLAVESLDAAVSEAGGAITGLGGFAANEDVDLADSNRATIVYRVPAPQFRAALSALSDIGELRSQTIDSTDVTSQYADLDGRVTTLRTSIGRLQGFLGETTDVNQIASLEGELTRRESELESIEGQRRALADQIELSTITVSFDATTASPATEPARAGFSGGLDAGWDVAVTVAGGASAAAGFLVPFLPLIAVVVGLGWWLRRRSHRAEREPATAAR